MNNELFWTLLMANIIGGVINTIIFYTAAILIALILYKKNKKLLKKLRKIINYGK